MAGKGGARPGAGRPKGTLNSISHDFRRRMESLCREHGLDLHKFPIDIIKNEELDMQVRLAAWKEIAARMWPTLKAQELEMKDGLKVTIVDATVREKS